jgi:Xaa-Pro aminopeptidase
MRPANKFGRTNWDPINLPESEFQSRIRTLQKELQKSGLDILFLFGANEYGGNAAYLTNNLTNLTAVPAVGDVFIFHVGNSRELPAIKYTTWVKEVRFTSNMVKDVVAYLNEKNLFPSTIGLAGFKQNMAIAQYQSLMEALKPCRIVDFTQEMANLRSVKSVREIDQMRRASRIIKRLFTYLGENLPKKMDEKELEAVIQRFVRNEGGEDCRVLFGRNRSGDWSLRPYEEAPLFSGESISIYVAVQWERYWSECVRTLQVGPAGLVSPPPGNAQAIYHNLLQGLKPGNTFGQFYQETLAQLKKGKAECLLGYGMGNGIGLDLQEFPRIAADEASPLKEGMCLGFHMAIKDPAQGTVMLGDTVCLSQEGLQRLTE